MSTQHQPLNQGDRIYYRYGRHHQHLRNCVGTVDQVTPEGKVVATFRTDAGIEHYIIDRDQATKTL